MTSISYLTEDKFFRLTKKYEGEHWTPETITQRWNYHSRVIELLKALDIRNPHGILEMGTMGISCVDDSDTIDYTERWNYPGKNPTYIHDARSIPWPIKNKQYEVFIALRVFQHLTPLQMECAKEAVRIARRVIIVVPEEYDNEELPNSRGITYSDFIDYFDGVHPNIFLPMNKECLYYWDTENPSNLNLENIMRQVTLTKYQNIPLEHFIIKLVRACLRTLVHFKPGIRVK